MRDANPGPGETKSFACAARWILCFALLGTGCVDGGAPGGTTDSSEISGGILLPREDFYGVDVVDRERAWIVGSYGTVLRVSKGGERIELLVVPSRVPLFAVSFADPSDGLVAGRQGTMFHTQDAGKSWERIELPGSRENVLAMTRSPDGRSVWAVGPRGMILRSRDSGRTWKDLSLERDVTLNGVTFSSADDGWIVGEFGTILHTRNAGDHWEERNETIRGLPKYVEPGVSDEVALRVGIPELFQEDLYVFDVAFPNETTGYAVAAGGFVLKTEDRGESWDAIYDLTRNSLLRLAPVRADGGLLAVGILGTFARLEDGRWRLLERVSRDLFTWIRDASFSADGALGVAVGGKASILISSDAGKTWAPVDPSVLSKAAESAEPSRG